LEPVLLLQTGFIAIQKITEYNSHRSKAVQPAIMPVGVYWSIRTIDMLNKKQPAFITNRT